jgi:phage RecT family recombinase
MSSTGTSIAIIERNLDPLQSRFDHLVTPVGLDAKRWRETLFLACERNPKLLDFPVKEHIRLAMTSATLGLEADGAMGQLFAIPFGGKNPCIQAVIGYKGMTTMAARAGIAISGDVLREGDVFDHRIRAGAAFEVELRFGDRQRSPIIGAWAQAQLPNGSWLRPVVMDLSELEAVRAKSPGAKKYDSPWNDHAGPGFGAMCAKTAKRRLQRDLPAILTRGLESMNISQHHVGAQLETLHEEVGRHTFIDEKATVIDAGVIDVEPQPVAKVEWRIEIGAGVPIGCASGAEWIDRFKRGIAGAHTVEQINGTLKRNEAVFDELWKAGHEKEVMAVKEAAELRVEELK